jgi:hypothetical protein
MVYDGGGGGSALDRWGGEGERGERLHSHLGVVMDHGPNTCFTNQQGP